ncbi:hypothetical protein CEXT_641061 [Caerostris extrusa]|uniref:Uncharacterized protein n=1 Tax=Caerostris extrusa TaxID=172846 RepID=A0AAV4MUY3_CAEEX|nr:hypothetical protein CEXT_641061 [Caerostris extrusa]
MNEVDTKKFPGVRDNGQGERLRQSRISIVPLGVMPGLVKGRELSFEGGPKEFPGVRDNGQGRLITPISDVHCAPWRDARGFLFARLGRVLGFVGGPKVIGQALMGGKFLRKAMPSRSFSVEARRADKIHGSVSKDDRTRRGHKEFPGVRDNGQGLDYANLGRPLCPLAEMPEDFLFARLGRVLGFVGGPKVIGQVSMGGKFHRKTIPSRFFD